MAAAMLMSECQLGIAGGGVGLNGFGGGGGGGSGHNGSGSAQVPWNRNLERALEEAAATGVLNLSGRKLKEFPRSAANQDLTDTTQADLSKNRLVEIPAEVCYFVSLESLNLYQNCIRSIPEAILNLQSLTFLNISRNQLTTLPGPVCNLPLKVLIASNNKLISVPEEIGLLRQLTELDVSCNEIQALPPQIGNLEILRDLNLRRNHLVTLPEELADLPLVRLDISCNKVTTIPVCYRNLRHLQTIILDNNPLQSPPAQICIKGKIHIFKYLNIEACKSVPDLPEYDRTRPIGFNSCHEDYFAGRPYGALDSGFNSVDSGDKRWSGNEPTDEFSDLPQRMAEIAKEQRQRRESQYHEHRAVPLVTNGTVEHDLEQIDYIDSCAAEEEEEEMRLSKRPDSTSLSSQFIAYIERRRINYEASPVKSKPVGDPQRTENERGWLQQSRNEVIGSKRPETLQPWHDSERQQTLKDRGFSDSSLMSQTPSSGQNMASNVGCTELELQRRREQLLVERTRREAQLAAQQYEEERIRTKQIQKEAVLDFVRQKSGQSPQKQSPSDSDHNDLPKYFPIRRSQHTDDSALLVNEERPPVSPSASFTQSSAHTVQPVPPYPGSSPHSYKQPTHAHRPENFLLRAAMRDEMKKDGTSASSSVAPSQDSGDALILQNQKQYDDEQRVVYQLRKNIETRLKVSLPSDLGTALTDGVVLCHLANHVRPRSVPSIHVPSPAVPKLTMAKCRRNVENFLEACKRIGVPQDDLCSSSDVLQANLLSTQKTVDILLTLGASITSPVLTPLSGGQLAGFALFYINVMLLLFALYHWVTVF
ncbi:DISP complex protein LRCH3-like isoform X1 [Carcharodon carcharias]|uniref:DISP complex protein LRCH3-like isoform X1 n=1 Tax=Carcharodon carcharias TaxID=13397 RepID=UPI001B7DE5B0|nr:DISP complex protein LRCH3-like isoform X1 [Carcharodon carcharias]